MKTIIIDGVEYNLTPKVAFCEGDWVVNTITGNVEQIIEITSNEYICSGTLVVSFDNQHLLNRWTIQDAKDGDVLANDHHILILKELDYNWSSNGTPNSVKAYCGIKPKGNFEIGKDNWCFCGTLHIHPATKEQRDLLFKKMKEAGYEWDDEKKELKKIEQKPIKVPKFKIGDFIQFNGMGHTRYTIKEVCGLSHYINSLDRRMDMSYTDANFELVEQNLAWSEEDEMQARQIERIVHDYGCSRKLQEQIADWLKSLKERVLSKPTWSEDDDEHLERILKELENQCQRPINSPYLDKIESDYNWLKSLRPQKQWKVVDKEIYVEEPAIAQKKDKSEPNHGYVICYDHTLTPDVYERFIMISDIHPQKHWKPSSQQICSVDYVIKEYESTNISLNKEAVKQLISLREQLKAL